MVKSSGFEPPCLPRAIIALDLDCFYAQVAIRSRPHLKDKPVVIVQKHLCVTSNYIARAAAHGAIQKMTPVSEALKACPNLVLIDGSDLTPFRAANREVMKVVRSFLGERSAALSGAVGEASCNVPCQKLGLDEIFIDLTRLVEAEAATRKRPFHFDGCVTGSESNDDIRRSLMLASQLAAELRAKVTEITTLTLCAGVSTSKLLAKLAVNMNKPNDQTTLLPEAARDLVGSLAPRSLPGFGYAAEAKLKAWAQRQQEGPEFNTAAGIVRRFGVNREGLAILARIMGREATARNILDLCRGEDSSAVVDSGDAPKSMTSMDSCHTCTTMNDVRARVRARAADLVTRLRHDFEIHSRRPKTLTVTFRFNGDGFVGTTRTTAMPSEVASLCSRRGGCVEAPAITAVSSTTLLILKDCGHVYDGACFDLTLIAIGASNFLKGLDTRSERAPARAASSFFGKRKSNYATATAEELVTEVPRVPGRCETERQRAMSITARLFTCPVCGKRMSMNVEFMNIHVDACLRTSEGLSQAPPKAAKTSSNTRRVDSFFRKPSPRT